MEDDLGDLNNSMFLLASERVHYSSVIYSLKKRKRWTLVERISTNQLNDIEANDLGNVTFIHRRVERKLEADCIAIHKINEDRVFRSKKHLYAKAADLLANNKGIKIKPELCYEMSYRYSKGSYPLYAEVHKTQAQDSSFGEDATSEPQKSRLKVKGTKHKRARRYVFSDAQLRKERILPEEPVEMSSCKVPLQFSQNKITLMNSTCFNLCRYTNEALSNNDFELGHLVEKYLQNRGCYSRKIKGKSFVRSEKDSELQQIGPSEVTDIETEKALRRTHAYEQNSPDKKTRSVVSSVTNVVLKDLNFHSKLLYSEVVSQARKLTEPSLLPDRVSDDLQELCVEICEAENDTTPIDKLPDHMTSFPGFPGISSRHPGTIINESHAVTFETKIGEENMVKMVSL